MFMFNVLHYIEQVSSERKVKEGTGAKMQNKLLHLKTEEEAILRKLLNQLEQRNTDIV